MFLWRLSVGLCNSTCSLLRTHQRGCRSWVLIIFFFCCRHSLNQRYSQSTTNKMQRFSNLFISVRRSTCFRRFYRPSSGAQNCTYSIRHLSDRYCYLLLAAGSSNGLTLYVRFCVPDDGRKNHLKHVERLTEINKFEKHCILLVVLWEHISDARTYEC